MLSNNSHLLLVEDEVSIREPLASYLEKNGYRVTQSESAEKARMQLSAYSIELAILDVMMPGEDGLSLCRYIRETREIPIIFLTARTEETERIIGLEMGADDYVTKPFNPRELLARIKAVLRRTNAGGNSVKVTDSGSYAFEGWVLKSGERALVDSQGVMVPLSTGEYNLLLVLVTHPRQVMNRDQLLDLTQGRAAEAFDRAIDNQVVRLRKKIEQDPKKPKLLQTVWGGGYTLAADVTQL